MSDTIELRDHGVVGLSCGAQDPRDENGPALTRLSVWDGQKQADVMLTQREVIRIARMLLGRVAP